jgi:hypothetical protein
MRKEKRHFTADALGRVWRIDYDFWDPVLFPRLYTVTAVTLPGHEASA